MSVCTNFAGQVGCFRCVMDMDAWLMMDNPDPSRNALRHMSNSSLVRVRINVLPRSGVCVFAWRLCSITSSKTGCSKCSFTTTSVTCCSVMDRTAPQRRRVRRSRCIILVYRSFNCCCTFSSYKRNGSGYDCVNIGVGGVDVVVVVVPMGGRVRCVVNFGYRMVSP